LIPDPESPRLARALAAIDAANAGDPHTLRVRGELRPKELAHAELVSSWVLSLRPDASEALRLAARAHHVRRWEIPRADFPQGRAGYHRWRRALHAHHARILGAILRDAGYEPELIARAQAIVAKQGLGRDPEVQALEDALCLVFLETQLRDVAGRLAEEKLLDVTRKTLAKMSAAAIERAKALVLDPESRALLERAAAPAAIE
jgi:hypothetical protein